MNTSEQLTKVFNDNFVTYFRSHVAHLNIVGRNFVSDHKLLEKIYEDLQDQIDTIGELLRTLNTFAPSSLPYIIDNTEIDTFAFEETADGFLHGVKYDLEYLKGCYEELMAISENEGHEEIANYAQDRILKLAKFIWMLTVTLE